MNELITIKGSSSGLQLIVDKQADFGQVKQALAVKLAASAGFFRSDTEILLKNSSFSSQEHIVLKELLGKYHLMLKLSGHGDKEPPDKKNSSVQPSDKDEKSMPDKLIRRTVRGGEEIIYKGSIVIYGNVNPGATVIAGGNIDIHGRCRGVVHAGAFGNHDAFIVADKLTPLQIRIADFIARSPDDAVQPSKAMFTEMACIKDGNIVLEPFDR